MPVQFQPAHPRHADVQDEAAWPGRIERPQKRLRGLECLHLQSHGLQQQPDRFAYLRIIVDHEYGLRIGHTGFLHPCHVVSAALRPLV